jgi:imidazolonepropionase-like amidohydrolase
MLTSGCGDGTSSPDGALERNSEEEEHMKHELLGAAMLACAGVGIAACTQQTGAQQGQTQAQAQVPAPPIPDTTIVIRGATLIDGLGGAPVPNSVIVIERNRITAVGPADQVQIPADVDQTIDGTGKWVLPGLIDAKANWNWQYGEAFLHWGVTSAMVSGARNDQGIAERDAVNYGIYPAPRLFQTYIGIRGRGPECARRDTYVPGEGNKLVCGADEAVLWTQHAIDGGADFITFGDGDGPPEWWKPAIDLAVNSGKAVVYRAMGPQTRAREVCDMANGAVYVHTGNVGAQIAADESKWATYTGLPPDAYADMDDAKAAAMIQHLVGCNAYLEPDLMAADRGFHKNWARVQQEDRDVFTDPNLAAYYPVWAMEDLWENVQSPEEYLRPEQIELRKRGFAGHVAFLKRYVDAGGKIVAASDITQSAPGLGLHQEMAAFVEDVGLTPMQAIQSATKWVAEGFKQPDLGSLETGKLADIILVNADPTVDILNLRQVDTVIKNGEVVDRSYHPWYRGDMFSNDRMSDDDPIVAELDAVEELKATVTPAVLTGAVAAPAASPLPAIEKIHPYTVIQGTGDTELTITGFNFVAGSQVSFDGERIPVRVVSPTEIRATVWQNLLARAGKFAIAVENPAPAADAEGGTVSNRAYMLVPFSFTTTYSKNQW